MELKFIICILRFSKFFTSPPPVILIEKYRFCKIFYENVKKNAPLLTKFTFFDMVRKNFGREPRQAMALPRDGVETAARWPFRF